MDCSPSGSARIGRLNRISDHSGTTTFCFDHRGNVYRKIQRQGSITLTTAWTHDLADRVLTMTYPSGLIVSYSHDGIGRIDGLYLSGATVAGTSHGQLISAVLYEPFGPVKRIDYGDGHFQARSFDQNYWISSINSTRNIGLSAYFEHDAAGNIVRLSREVLGTGGGNGSDRNIGYDDLYRITDVRDRNNVLLESFSYDATGNRLSKASTTQGAPNLGNYTYANDSHRLTHIGAANGMIKAAPENGEARHFDAAGNLLSKSYNGGPFACCGASYVYDDRNRMETVWVSGGGAVQEIAYRHNGRGERVWRSGSDGKPTLYVYDEAGRLLGEYNNTGALISEVIWLDDLPVGVRRAGVVYPIEPDHLGTPRTIHNQNTLLWHWDLIGPIFGEHAPNDTPSGTQFRFDLRYPGQQYDPTSGLHYNYFRDYEPGTGRYVESDPIGLRGGLGTYGYVESIPIRASDRFGLFTISPFEDRSAHIGGTVICDDYWLTYELYWSEPCTRHCAVEHELSHLRDVRVKNPSLCSTNTGKAQVFASNEAEKDWTEMGAYSTELGIA
jgi:RHS repeat-associated protein